MAGGRIKGITIELGADVTELTTALKGVESQIRTTQSSLFDIQPPVHFMLELSEERGSASGRERSDGTLIWKNGTGSVFEADGRPEKSRNEKERNAGRD